MNINKQIIINHTRISVSCDTPAIIQLILNMKNRTCYIIRVFIGTAGSYIRTHDFRLAGTTEHRNIYPNIDHLLGFWRFPNLIRVYRFHGYICSRVLELTLEIRFEVEITNQISSSRNTLNQSFHNPVTMYWGNRVSE